MSEGNYDENGVHYCSKKELDNILPFAPVSFPYSEKDNLARYSILGILGYTHLLPLIGANIIEIGVGESSIYLTEVARRLHRKIYYCDAADGKIINPMTVPGYLHEDTIRIKAGTTEQYWMHQGIAFCGTSDDFFKELSFERIGLAFIDGDHGYEQVKKDFNNIFELLIPHGVIFLHDTFAYNEELVLGEYCSDAYKVRKELELDTRVDCFTFTKTVAVVVGLTMIRKKQVNGAYYNE